MWQRLERGGRILTLYAYDLTKRNDSFMSLDSANVDAAGLPVPDEDPSTTGRAPIDEHNDDSLY
jgi:hypothetical protein